MCTFAWMCGCDDGGSVDQQRWPEPAKSGKVVESLTGSSGMWAATSPCEAAASFSGHFYEGVTNTMVSVKTDAGDIRSYVELKGKEGDSFWFSVAGGVYKGTGHATSCGMSFHNGDTLLYLGDSNAVVESVETPIPQADEVAKRLEDGSIQLVYGIITAEDADAFLTLVGDDTYTYDGTCDLSYLGQ